MLALAYRRPVVDFDSFRQHPILLICPDVFFILNSASIPVLVVHHLSTGEITNNCWEPARQISESTCHRGQLQGDAASRIADQSMRIPVAVQTPSVLTMGCHGMRQAMAILATGHCRMRAIMAINAAQCSVVGGRSGKIAGFLAVAGLAECRGKAGSGLNLQWAVCPAMAFKTVRVRLHRQVRLMACQTAGNKPMPIMAVGAKKLRMPAGRRRHLLPPLGMTGKTFRSHRFHRIPQGSQRLMRVGMAIQAVINLEMRFSLMAKDTGGYGIFPFRRMFRVAVKATDLGGVFPALGGKSLQLKRMTLGAIILLQPRLRLLHGKKDHADQKKESCQPAAFQHASINIVFPAGKNRFHKALGEKISRPITGR